MQQEVDFRRMTNRAQSIVPSKMTARSRNPECEIRHRVVIASPYAGEGCLATDDVFAGNVKPSTRERRCQHFFSCVRSGRRDRQGDRHVQSEQFLRPIDQHTPTHFDGTDSLGSYSHPTPVNRAHSRNPRHVLGQHRRLRLARIRINEHVHQQKSNPQTSPDRD